MIGKASRWAVIGVGGMGRWHVEALLKRPDVQVVAACDVDAGAMAGLPPTVQRFADWQALIQQAEIDGASVILPHHLYPQVVSALLRRGVHVLKEKPFARNLDDAIAMCQVARESGGDLMVAGQRKFKASFIAAQRLLPDLGDIFLVRAAILYRYDPIALEGKWGWRGAKYLSGGVALVDSGWHVLEMLTLLRGMPSRVMATTGQMRISAGDHDVDEQAALLLEYADGGVAVVVASFVALPQETRLILHGKQATLDIDIEHDQLTRYEGQSAHPVPLEPQPDPITAMYDQFITRIQAGERPYGNWAEALQVQRLIEAGYRSAAQGGSPVSLSAVPDFS